MKNLKKTLYLIAVLIMTGGIFNDIYAKKIPAYRYLGEVPSARAIGMGGAYSSADSGVYSSYWNPAAIAVNNISSVGLSANIASISSLPADDLLDIFNLRGENINYVSLSANQVALYFRPLSRISETSVTAAGEEKLVARVSQAGVTVAVPSSDVTDFGMNINYIGGMAAYGSSSGNEQEIKVVTARGWSIDWGLLFKFSSFVWAGASITNAPGKIFWTEGLDRDELPMTIRTGISLMLTGNSTLAVDYENNINDDFAGNNDLLHFGIEQVVSETLFIRAGVFGKNLNSGENLFFSGGIGYIFMKYKLDLAVTQLDTGSTTKSQRISLSGELPF